MVVTISWPALFMGFSFASLAAPWFRSDLNDNCTTVPTFQEGASSP